MQQLRLLDRQSELLCVLSTKTELMAPFETFSTVLGRL
jgi:hypothetical protein